MSDIDVGYSIDPSGYLAGVNQIDQANQRLQRSFSGVVTTSSGIQRALTQVTPTRATLGAMALLAQQAGQTEQGLSGLAATSTITRVNVDKLSGGIRQMARDMPLGYQSSKGVVEQITRMGVGAAGSERKVLDLSRSVAKLSGSTGDGPAELAQGMVDLSRATGNTNLDPKRFAALGDALTTVSAQSGAGATNVLSFAKNIAPLAQASGIGSTGVLGISAAFAKLGEDGFGASNAVNKMLTDLNRSVREGSPEIKTYAQIVGMIPDEFERLFKQNPAEALTRVTESIAKAGPGGPRMLEQIGIEGVRGQRSLQALVASGGMRESIRTATEAYGSGSTDRASEAAFGGLNDSLTELRETSSELASAMGEPLLKPLTGLANILKTVTGGAANVAGSGMGQAALNVAGYGGLGLLAARSVIGPLGALALGRQALTSSPMRALAAGWASATGSTGRLARFGAPAEAAYGTNRMGPVATRLYNFASGVGGGLREGTVPFGPQPAPQPSFWQRARTGAASWGAAASETYMRSVAQQYTNAATTPFQQARERRDWRTPWRQGALRFDERGNPIMTRRDAFVPSTAVQAATRAAQRVDTTGMNQWQTMRAGMSAFNKELQATTGQTSIMRTQFKALGSMVAAQGRAGGALIGDAARGAGGALGRVGSFLGPGMALTAGIGFATWAYQRGQDQKAENAALKDQDISGVMNSYRESIGKATDSTKTFGSLTQQLADQLSKNASKSDFSSVLQITDEDRRVAEGSRDKKTQLYGGTTDQVAAQIQAQAPNGISPDEMQAIKVDLLRQMPDVDVARVLKALPGGIQTGGGQPGAAQPDFYGNIRKTVTAATSADRNALGNFMMAGSGFGDLDDANAGDPIRSVAAQFHPGGALYANPLSDTAMKQVDAVRQGIGQRFDDQSGKFGVNYAMQERLKGMNTALKEAYDKGNVEVFYELSKRFGSDLGADPNKVWSANEFAAKGFDFSKVVAGDQSDGGQAFAKTLQGLLAAGAKTTGTGGISPELQRSIYYDTIKPESAFLANAFDSTSKSPAAQAMAASLGTPADVKLQETATNAIVAGAKDAGKSMSELAMEATKAANATAEGSDAWVRLKQVQQRAEQQMNYQLQGATPGQQQLQQYDYYRQQASITPTSESQRQDVEAAKQKVMEIEDQMRQRLVARLQMQRQADVSAARATEDFNRQQLYSTQDFNTQVYRTERNFQIQREQSDHQFKIGQQRAEVDFQTSRKRAVRDANISIARAEADFNTARTRQMRDYNKQLRRSIEDAASSMYDPYSRIQAKPTWDVANLGVNLQEQTAAMQKQKSQLDALRKQGLSATAIDQLGLGKAENAQQVDQLAGMSAADIAALNKQVQERAKAAGALYTDDSNKELKRQREDLNTALKDQETDFKKSIGRQREDLNRSLADSAKDFAKSMGRQSEDYAYSLKQSRRQLNISLEDMAADRDRSMKRSKQALDTQLGRMQDDIRMADQTISGSMADLAEQTNRAIHGKSVKWQKILKDDTKSWVTDMQKNVIPQLGSVFSAYGVTPGRTAGTGASPASGNRNVGVSGANQAINDRAWGSGGEVAGRSMHEKADDIPARLTAGEFVHNVMAVRHYGTELMHALNNRSIPKQKLIEARGYAGGGWVNPVAPVRPGFPWGHYPSGRVHRALDYPVPVGTPVYSPYAGTVLVSGWSTTGFGNHIRMLNEPNKDYSILGHLSRLIARAGQQVAQHQLLGLSGSTGNSTGPHLHLEMRTRLNDPNSAYNFTTGSMAGDIAAAVQAIAGSATRQATMAGLFANMRNVPGPYNQLTAEYKKRLEAKLYDQGGVIPHGGVGVNLSGKPERVLTDLQWSTLSSLAARGGAVGVGDVRDMRTAGGMHIVINNSGAVTYDQRNDFGDANITVMSQDPDDMARKLAAKKHRQRLTQTRGVRR